MIKNILNIGIGQLASLLITFLIGVIISRYYGPDGKGLITILILIPTLVSTYAGVSIEEGFLYNIGKDYIPRRTFDLLLLKVFLIFVPIFLIVYSLVYFLLDSFQYYYLPQLFLIVALLFNNIFKFALRATLNFKRYNLVQVVEPFVILLGLLLIISLNAATQFLIWAYVLSYILSLVLQYGAIRKKLDITGTRNVSLKSIFSYSYKVHFFKILNFTEAKFDVLLLGFLSTVTSVGIYSVSVSLAALFQAIVQTPISSVLYPALIKSSIESRTKVATGYFKLSYFLSLGFLIGMLTFGSFFITNVYGREFQAAYLPLVILILGSLPKASAACINSYFKATGKPEELYKTSVYTVVINVALCFILIPKYDIVGASIASAISYFTYSAIMIAKFLKASNLVISNLWLNKDDVEYGIGLIKRIIRK